MTERTINIDDHVFVLKPLTRGQMKTLKKSGFTKTDDPETLETIVDMALKMSLPDIDPDDLPCYLAANLFRELMDLTWGIGAEKN